MTLVKRDVDNDFNGDGRSDVLWRNDGGTLTTWLGQHDGGFVGDPTFYRNFSEEWQVVGTGDFNGDGRDDILFRNGEGIVTDWLGLPIGGFAENTANVFNAAGLDWRIVGTGDFNGDGRDDVLWRNEGGTVTTWLGQADGGFVGDPSVYEAVGLNWFVVGTGDFNGDGYDDILWRNDQGIVTNWLGQAEGGFTENNANVYNAAGLDWQVYATGDFNGDGRDDVLWRNNWGTVTSWLGQKDGGFVGDETFYTNVAQDWLLIGTGDFNGDGFDDILWRNDQGIVTDWLGKTSGGFTPNTANAYNPAGLDWHIEAPTASQLDWGPIWSSAMLMG